MSQDKAKTDAPKNRRIVVKLASTNRAAAMYERMGPDGKTPYKQKIAIPLSYFEGDPPAELPLTANFNTEIPTKVRKSALKVALEGKSKEEKAAIRKKLAEARAKVLQEAGITDPDGGGDDGGDQTDTM